MHGAGSEFLDRSVQSLRKTQTTERSAAAAPTTTGRARAWAPLCDIWRFASRLQLPAHQDMTGRAICVTVSAPRRHAARAGQVKAPADWVSYLRTRWSRIGCTNVLNLVSSDTECCIRHGWAVARGGCCLDRRVHTCSRAGWRASRHPSVRGKPARVDVNEAVTTCAYPLACFTGAAARSRIPPCKAWVCAADLQLTADRPSQDQTRKSIDHVCRIRVDTS